MKKICRRSAEFVARAAHEMHNLFCEIGGDPRAPEWENLTPAQKKCAITGAIHAINGASLKALHDLSVAARKREGWVYGPAKDFNKKISSALMPYRDLSVWQRHKLHVFKSTCRLTFKLLGENKRD